MSEYKIVNRVHPTPAFAQTVAEVEAQAELDKSLPLVQEVAQNPEVAKVLRKRGFNVPLVGSDYEEPDEAFKFLEVPQMAEASRAPFVGKVVEDWSSCDVCKPADPLNGHLCEEHVEPEVWLVTRTEFEQLKADLVLAFKKMGFDVSL